MPPIIAQRFRIAIYPRKTAFAENEQFVIRACTGSLYSGRTGDFHGYPFSVHGYYDWRNWAVALTLCRKGDTLIEIGANVGTETVGFRDIVGPRGKVIAIEPYPANLATLRQQVELNRWNNVEILPLAIGERSGVVSFVPPPDEHATGEGYIAGQGGVMSINVQCASLDSLAEQLGEVRAIFCDTEGAELMVLKGAHSYLRQVQPALVIEASPKLLMRAGTSLEELRRCLHDMRYAPFVIERFGVSQVRNSTAKNAENWLCLPQAQTGVALQCASMIRKCAVLPCLPRINPLCRLGRGLKFP